MANPVCEVLLTESPLEIGDTTGESIVNLECGAVVEFQGIVRRLEQDQEIAGIEYEAHSAMATHQMELIAREAAKRFELALVFLHHRIGFVPAGEASLWLRVASGHRGPAFDAATWIVEELKRRVTIWKRPKFKIDRSSPALSVEARAQETTPVSSPE